MVQANTAMKFLVLLFVALLLPLASSCFVTTERRAFVVSRSALNAHRQTTRLISMTASSDNHDAHPGLIFDRRSMFKKIAVSAAAAAALSSTTALPVVFAATDNGKGKIVVFGGSGYVGSFVSQNLVDRGYKVVSVSRSSPSDQATKIEKILGKPLSMIDYVSLDASTDDITNIVKDSSAVVSCVGIAPGGSNQRAGNGAVNIRIADAAKAAGVQRFVYVGVASELANGPAKFLLGDYLKGKAEAEAAVLKDFGKENSLVVKPAIIAGGPPGELRPPGPPGVKPASVESVANAVVAGALGEKSGTIDGNAAL